MSQSPSPSFRSSVLLTRGIYLVIGLPLGTLLAALGFLSPLAAFFFLLAFGIPGVPTAGALAALLSRSEATPTSPLAFLGACATPAAVYSFFAGGVTGGILYGPIAGLLLSVVAAVLGFALGIALARHIPRILPAA